MQMHFFGLTHINNLDGMDGFPGWIRPKSLQNVGVMLSPTKNSSDFQ